ncbi:hypothetical protein TWF694_002025 [Orbilia ellipsospora]|uniref:Uncharacterized protein n=1 Tax=Orbilia ellipsospora TaxID=2528407 RepID=A0AAV9X5H5_9PEZI
MLKDLPKFPSSSNPTRTRSLQERKEEDALNLLISAVDPYLGARLCQGKLLKGLHLRPVFTNLYDDMAWFLNLCGDILFAVMHHEIHEADRYLEKFYRKRDVATSGASVKHSTWSSKAVQQPDNPMQILDTKPRQWTDTTKAIHPPQPTPPIETIHVDPKSNEIWEDLDLLSPTSEEPIWKRLPPNAISSDKPLNGKTVLPQNPGPWSNADLKNIESIVKEFYKTGTGVDSEKPSYPQYSPVIRSGISAEPPPQRTNVNPTGENSKYLGPGAKSKIIAHDYNNEVLQGFANGNKMANQIKNGLGSENPHDWDEITKLKDETLIRELNAKATIHKRKSTVQDEDDSSENPIIRQHSQSSEKFSPTVSSGLSANTHEALLKKLSILSERRQSLEAREARLRKSGWASLTSASKIETPSKDEKYSEDVEAMAEILENKSEILKQTNKPESFVGGEEDKLELSNDKTKPITDNKPETFASSGAMRNIFSSLFGVKKN